MSRYWHVCAWVAYLLSFFEGALIHDQNQAEIAATHMLGLGIFFLLLAIYYRRPAVSPEAPHA